jgi:beta-lactam-binding protein with PASTA domain
MVLHRAGDPAVDGAPFAYPVVPGPVYKVGGPSSVVVTSPWPEVKPEGATTPVVPVTPSCVVPKLLGKSLKANRRRLKRAGCRLGEVARVGGATAKNGRVIRQSPKQGTVLESGAAVQVTLGRQAKDG